MANLQKTIFGYQIKSFEFLRTYNHRLRKHVISGIIWLESSKRVRIENGSYYLINLEGDKEAIILKTNPAYKWVKRMIARWFQTYRKGCKSFFRERISTLREACQQAEYSLRIKMIQRGRISFNHYFTAS
ncbi:uncharacterized protein CHSO_1051 [Chryseobacterium sp. StRB126]|uniref:hypothetical protein n=1 Tax=Chryseobacterium sp. StRB126 TaxID=878220 RepID=UPI0004E99D1D|nr:hypothetical protein [Chryseobacterium sp. StRB126]BAP30088.1 uncharacterized protein CHSO_1051 [Chryseobacterium sp. StRB126]